MHPRLYFQDTYTFLFSAAEGQEAFFAVHPAMVGFIHEPVQNVTKVTSGYFGFFKQRSI